MKQLLSDFIRDLRDRRLLAPAGALVVAIVAVPIVLSSTSDPVPPPTLAPVDDAAGLQSAVLVEQPGIRNYRKRLADLKETDPFEQQFAAPAPGSGSAADSASAATGVEDPSSAPMSQASTGGSPAPPTDSFSESNTDTGSPVTEVDETTVDDTTVDETVVNEDVSEPAEPKPQTRFYAGRVDVTIGPLGRAKRLENVRYLEFLPDDKAPVVAFLGLTEGAKRAVFSVSRDVASTDGEGSCAPKRPAPCQFLTLKVGEQRTFGYADGKTYRLRLLETRVVRVPDPRKPEPRDDDRNG